ncbi:hypothetical protein TSACC_22489 [Terrimicrobium sacchariphilum]|uniref:Uncharacterized protein n=2 Tax=Terrimicrobium sacchariphilum TaxID=690879 RepID=A0A146GC00_TERSA|nr:hypothetical protein TSACC_22489 [Terrimicrobium sacchariphilum]
MAEGGGLCYSARMCNRYRTVSAEWRAGQELELEVVGGDFYRPKWAGSATVEKLKRYWLREPGSELAQTREDVTEVSETAEDDGELQWCAAPAGARLLFVIAAPPPGKTYRLAKLITTAATPDQAAYFRRDRFPLLGRLTPSGEIAIIPPLPAPPPKPKPQGELF